MSWADWFRQEVLYNKAPKRVANGRPQAKKRRYGLILQAYSLEGFGGVNTPTQTTLDVAGVPNPYKQNYLVFGDDALGREAEAYANTFLTSLPEGYMGKLITHIGKTRNPKRLDAFWETAAELSAKKNGTTLSTTQAGAKSLAGLAGIRAKIAFQKAEPGGIKPWHYLIFFFESKYNPFKWRDYWDYKLEALLVRISQTFLNPKKASFEPAAAKIEQKIFTESAGAFRSNIFFAFLFIYRAFGFAVSTILNSRLYHYFKEHPYLFTFTFVVFLAIGLTCVFFPPAAAFFFAFSPELIAFLSVVNPLKLFGLSILAVYVSLAIARAVSQIYEVALTVISDLWVIAKDKNLFLRKHPIIASVGFSLAVAVTLILMFTPPFGLLIGLSAAAAIAWPVLGIYLSGLVSCKFCHIYDFFKEGKWKDFFKSSTALEKEVVAANSEAIERRRRADAAEAQLKLVEALERQEEEKKEKEKQQAEASAVNISVAVALSDTQPSSSNTSTPASASGSNSSGEERRQVHAAGAGVGFPGLFAEQPLQQPPLPEPPTVTVPIVIPPAQNIFGAPQSPDDNAAFHVEMQALSHNNDGEILMQDDIAGVEFNPSETLPSVIRDVMSNAVEVGRTRAATIGDSLMNLWGIANPNITAEIPPAPAAAASSGRDRADSTGRDRSMTSRINDWFAPRSRSIPVNNISTEAAKVGESVEMRVLSHGPSASDQPDAAVSNISTEPAKVDIEMGVLGHNQPATDQQDAAAKARLRMLQAIASGVSAFDESLQPSSTVVFDYLRRRGSVLRRDSAVGLMSSRDSSAHLQQSGDSNHPFPGNKS